VLVAVGVEEAEVVVGVEGDNEIIETTVLVTTRLIRRTRSWNAFIMVC
jgi:hypothetical protein